MTNILIHLASVIIFIWLFRKVFPEIDLVRRNYNPLRDIITFGACLICWIQMTDFAIDIFKMLFIR